MLQGEPSAILWTFIKLPVVIKIFVLSIFEWSLKTGFTVFCLNFLCFNAFNLISNMTPIKKKNTFFLFDLILYVPSTTFQLNRGGSSWVEPVLS